MKFLAATLLAVTASALPTSAPNSFLDTRDTSTTRNDLSDGSSEDCPGVIFIFARGSTETGNLGSLGPLVATKLEDQYSDDGVWIQGVGGAYDATLADNALPRGTSDAAIKEMVDLFDTANTKCPNATIVAGGYSQGAALAAAAIEDVASGIRDTIAGTVLFGYTKNQQNNGTIPSYPTERTKIFCNDGDLVCTGSLIVTAAHLAYSSDASGAAPEFLIQRVTAYQAGSD